MKKFFLLVLTIALSFVLTTALAEDKFQKKHGSYWLELLDDGTVEIFDFWGEEQEGGDLIIPSVIDGYTVTRIGAAAFSDDRMSSVILPETVTFIGEAAFHGCESLISISLPENLTYIGYGAFDWCRSLNAITLPSGISSIEGYTFYGCSSLNSVILPDTLTSIGENAFSYCNSLLSVTIPESVTFIDEEAFDDCPSLYLSVSKNSYAATWCYDEWFPFSYLDSDFGYYPIDDNSAELLFYTGMDQEVFIPKAIDGYSITEIYDIFSARPDITYVKIPNSVLSVDPDTFANCSSLSYIDVSDSHPTLETVDGVLFNKEDEFTLLFYPRGRTEETYSVPAGTRVIEEDAFAGCDSLSSVNLPLGLSAIEYYAFAGCDTLSEIVLPNTLISLASEAFGWCQSLTTVYLPESILEIRNNPFEGCDSLTAFTVVEGSYAEQWCASNGFAYTYVEPETPKTDYEYYLQREGSIIITRYVGTNSEVIVPETLDGYVVTAIAERAFQCCDFISTIILPNTITSIGDYAFAQCSSLESIILSENIISIGNSAFLYCTALKEIDIPQGVTVIESDTFRGCDALSAITLPESILYVSDSAFDYGPSLVTITIPNSMDVSENLFIDCSSLRNINVSSAHPSLYVIDNVLFNKAEHKLICYPLGLGASSYSIPEGTKAIGDNAFKGSSLTHIDIPSSVEKIGPNAFKECKSLESIFLPDSILLIEWYTFLRCYALQEVHLPEKLEAIDSGMFSNCQSLKSITIPSSVSAIELEAFRNCYQLSSIVLPESITRIGPWAFDGCELLKPVVVQNSYAEQWCIENNFNYTYFESVAAEQ